MRIRLFEVVSTLKLTICRPRVGNRGISTPGAKPDEVCWLSMVFALMPLLHPLQEESLGDAGWSLLGDKQEDASQARAGYDGSKVKLTL